MNASLARPQGRRLLQGPLLSNSQWICSACALSQRHKRRRLSAGAFRDQSWIPYFRRDARNSLVGFKKEGSLRQIHNDAPKNWEGSPPKAPDGPSKAPTLEKNARRSPQGFLDQTVGIDDADLNAPTESLRLGQARADAFLRRDLVKAIRNNDMKGLEYVLGRGSEYPGFLAAIPKTTWSEIIKIFDPRHFKAPIHREHRSFAEPATRSLRRGLGLSEDFYLDKIVGFIGLRRARGADIGMREYDRLLSYAANLGNVKFARALWEDMRSRGMRPSPLSYQAFLEAMVWDEEGRFRAKRSNTRLQNYADPYNTDDVHHNSEAAVHEIHQVWQEMVDGQVEPSTRCYLAMLVVLARVRDKTAVERILLHAFDLDVGLILQEASGEASENVSGEETTKPHKPLDPQVARKLLSALPDIFGNLNEMPTGLRIIDHVSTTSKVPITKSIWYKMARWAWIQARSAPRENLRADIQAMQKHFSDIASMGTLMQSEAFNVSPNMDHRDLLIRANGLVNEHIDDPTRWGAMLSNMSQGRAELIKIINSYRATLRQQQHAERRHAAGYGSAGRVQLLRKRVADLRVKKSRVQIMLFRWAQLMLPNQWYAMRFERQERSSHGAAPSHAFQRWCVTGLPTFVAGFQNFMPPLVRYALPTGNVELQIRSMTEVRARRAITRTSRQNLKKFTWIRPSAARKKLTGRAGSGRPWVYYVERPDSELPRPEFEDRPAAAMATYRDVVARWTIAKRSRRRRVSKEEYQELYSI